MAVCPPCGMTAWARKPSDFSGHLSLQDGKTRRISDGCDGTHSHGVATPLMPGISTNAAGISWEACGIVNALSYGWWLDRVYNYNDAEWADYIENNTLDYRN